MVVFLLLAAANKVNSESFIKGTPYFDSSVPVYSKSGYLKLSWDFEYHSDVTYEINQSKDSSFKHYKINYKGPDLAIFESGLPNGDYYYRVRANFKKDGGHSGWSQPLKVTVEHHSLKLALILFSIGFVVFASTVILILYGNMKLDKD